MTNTRARDRGVVWRGAAGSGAVIFATAVVALPAVSEPIAKATGSRSVQHVGIVTHNRDVSASGRVLRSMDRSEEWHRGRQTHSVSRSDGRTAEIVVTADGTMTTRTPNHPDGVVDMSGTADTRRIIAMQQRGSVAQFLREFRAGRADPPRDVRFAGRPAERVVYHPHRDFPKRQVLYVDRKTGLPVGRTGSFQFSTLDGRKRTRYLTTRFKLIEALPPTAENVAKLTDFALAPPD